jgi:hypothetical protein
MTFTLPPREEHPVHVYMVQNLPKVSTFGTHMTRGGTARFQNLLKKALNARPYIRTRTSGLVGPEPDWSIVYSDPDRHGVKDAMDIRKGIFPYIEKINGRSVYGMPMAPHGCAHTFYMREDNVLKWTKWAHENGVHFHGKRGYTFRYGSGEPLSKKQEFDLVKDTIGVVKHKRSKRSVDARRLKRAAGLAARRAKLVPCVRVKYEVSAKKLRLSWRTNSPDTPFSKYRLTFDRGEKVDYILYKSHPVVLHPRVSGWLRNLPVIKTPLPSRQTFERKFRGFNRRDEITPEASKVILGEPRVRLDTNPAAISSKTVNPDGSPVLFYSTATTITPRTREFLREQGRQAQRARLRPP